MNTIVKLLLLVALLQLAHGARKAFRPQEKIVFYDDFDDFDLSVWRHEITAGGGGNWEFEYYTNNRSNSYVRDGVLYIKPTLTADYLGGDSYLTSGTLNLWGDVPSNLCTGNAWYGCFRQGGGGGNILNPIQSASVRTVQSFSYKYGRMEVKAKLPKGDWIWPAIWMLPQWNSYGDWPASGEIDIMESRGNSPSYTPGGCNQFGSTLHWGPYWAQDKWSLTHNTYTIPTGDLTEDFHVYGLVWSENTIYTYFDEPSNVVLNVTIGQSFWDYGEFSETTFDNPWSNRPNNAPFDQNFYLIFNVAVGGTGGYFPDGYGKPWSNTSPNAVNEFYDAKGSWYATWDGENSAMQIESVTVWQ